jgi:hypothetical protein
MIEHTPSATAVGFATLPAVAWLILFFRKPLIASAITAVVLCAVWLAFAKSSQPALAQQAPAAPAAPLPDLSQMLHHMEKIFNSWAMHSNFVALCFTVIVGIVAWMAIQITKLHVQNPRQVYYDPRALERQPSPPLLERPREEEEYRGKLPVVRSREI